MSETKKETKKEPKKVKLYNNRLDRTMAPVFRALTRALGMPDAIEYDDHFSADDDRPGQFNSWDDFNKSVDKWYDATNTGHSVCVPNPRYCPDPEYFGLGEQKKEEKPEPKKTTLEAAELKNHLRAFKMLVESVAGDEQYDKKKMSELVDAGLEQLIQIIDDFAVKKETKEEKDQREMDEFKDILDSI